MNSLLLTSMFALCIAVMWLAPVDGPGAVLISVVLGAIAAFTISRSAEDRSFLLQIFAGGLIVRMLVGVLTYRYRLQGFFGGDSLTYDHFGYAMLKSWQGDMYYAGMVARFGGIWVGMLYLVATVYAVVGRNMLAVQFVNAALGAATAPLIFLCAHHIYRNSKVARIAAFFVAFYPSLILWSSQGLKDGPIVFLLSVVMLATLKLSEKFSIGYSVTLICALMGLLSLRFYIFYMIVVAIGGAFFIGLRRVTVQNVSRQFVVIVTIGLALTYLGVLRTASTQLETYGDLQVVQNSRLDQAQSAQSGFSKDVDVSTTAGALSAIPLGLVYLLLAPFPWQMANLRQSITLPEMLIWWASFPLLVVGLRYTLKHRLRKALPILIFTAMLTLAYSIYQGNIGTAYRQRAQLQIFYFIFVAVGIVLFKEKRDDRRQLELARRQAEIADRFTQKI